MILKGPRGQGSLRIEGPELVPGQQCDSSVLDFHGGIQGQLTGHERVDRCLFPWTIVMLFFGKMYEPAVCTGAKHVVYVMQVGVLDRWRVPGPVATA